MAQSEYLRKKGLHLGIIMDGNGRWATARGLERTEGHRAGATALRRTVEAAPSFGISLLTVYGFSTENWKRPEAEVGALLELLASSLRNDAPDLYRAGVRLSFIGRRDRLPLAMTASMRAAEILTRPCTGMHLRVAIDYSARDAIVAAARRMLGRNESNVTREAFTKALGAGQSADAAPDLDLVIRTANERRLSDFLLWESAYAELHFTPTLWPDFGREDLARAMADYATRERRFGAAPRAPAALSPAV